MTYENKPVEYLDLTVYEAMEMVQKDMIVERQQDKITSQSKLEFTTQNQKTRPKSTKVPGNSPRSKKVNVKYTKPFRKAFAER